MYFELLAEVGDDVTGADICAVTALYTLGDIDDSEVVLDDDSVCGALSLALHAADAADLTHLHNLSALVLIAANGHDLLALGDELDDVLGADVNTCAAANTLVAVDLCNAVNDLHCAELAGIDTVAKTYAGEGAHLVALTAKQHCSLAVLGTVVVEAGLCNTDSAGAGNECNHSLCIACRNTHDLSNSSSTGSTTGNTAVGGSFACSNSSSVTVTAGESAAAAVCASQNFTDSSDLGVNLNVENLCSKSEQQAKQTTQQAQN